MVSFVFSGLYLCGILDNMETKEDLIQETSKGLEATILIIGQLTVLYKYIKSRSELKEIWWTTASPEERKIANKKNTGRSKNVKSRSSSVKHKPTSDKS